MASTKFVKEPFLWRCKLFFIGIYIPVYHTSRVLTLETHLVFIVFVYKKKR